MSKGFYSAERFDQTARRRIEKRTDRSTGCWVWVGGLFKAGYGKISYRGKTDYAHRVSYILHVGPVPEGLELDHKCRNRACCNPAHLEPVTHVENLYRSPIHPFCRAERRRAEAR